MITISGLGKHFGARTLFGGADLRVGARDRIAILGPNGSGKTTLFEMIVGRQQPDAGSIAINKDAVIGYLPQETDALRGRTVLEEVVAAGAAMEHAGHRLAVLEEELASNPGDAGLLDEYARLHERFDTMGGWSLETQATQILAGLGFKPLQMKRATDELSGGWLMRVALAKLLLASPDVLLLDEPTNHLDLASVVWLEGFLRAYDGAIMLITHDRDFMNGLVTRIAEIERAELVSYTGNYASFVEQRELRARQAEAISKNLARRRDKLEVFINRFRYKESKAKQVQAKIKFLERLPDAPIAPVASVRKMRLGFPPSPRSGRVVIDLRDVGFAYGDNIVYRDLGLSIERGQKVALVGPNGAGKTTLLKLIAGELEPASGARDYGHNVTVGYFAQHQIEALDPSLRVIEELARALPPRSTVRERDLLGKFLFSGDDIDKPVRVLSGGERSRLAMAKMLVSPFNLLCLDEPTNHLDVQSRDVLEDALIEYDGAMVLITHDRHLIRQVATRIVEVVDGQVRSFEGDYEYYLEKIEGEAVAPAAPRAAKSSPRSVKRKEAEIRQARSRVQAAIRRVETDLEKTHKEMETLGALLADPEFYTSADGVAEAVNDYERLQGRVSELEAEWERLTADLA